MKILLTGSNGMVGKNILEHSAVTNYIFLTPNSKELNLLNYDDVNSYIVYHKPDFVIHAAGRVGGIQINMKYPLEFLMDNLEMGKNLIQASKNNKVAYFMNIASSCMYPREANNPLNEELILKGELEPTNEGYALAKIISTRMCEYISRKNTDLYYKTIIPCNLFGRHDKFDPKHSHMLPAVIRKIHNAKMANTSSVDIWGDGQARREFMYAGDLADFIFYAINNYQRMPQNINVGLGYDYTINNYYETISKIIGFKGKFDHDLSKPVGMKRKLIDNSKLNNFGWKPKLSIEEGIQKTYNFFKKTINS